MNWKKIGIIIGILLILSVIGYYGLTRIVLCGKPGMSGGNPSLGPNDPGPRCCPGLKSIPATNKTFDENCQYTGFTGYWTICTDCGNNVCEKWESKCTCPEDCQ